MDTVKCDDTFKSAIISEYSNISECAISVSYEGTEQNIPMYSSSVTPLRAQRSLSDPLVSPSNYPMPPNANMIVTISNRATNNSNKSNISSRYHHPAHQSTTKHASRLQTPDASGDVTASTASTSRRSPRRSQRHSIAGQMSYFKMLGFGFGKKMASTGGTAAAAGGLFSTAVISGSSSAPNLRDMIANTASPSGKIIFPVVN